MKQKTLGEIFVIIMCFMLLIPNRVLAVTSISEYTIQSYNINIIVNEDNTFDITENITAYFNVAKRGIYRKIPLKNSITRTDGTKSNNKAKITDISVSENYTTSNENGYKVIKIGNANQTLKGKHSYTIKYKYNIGKDLLKNSDEFYFNLIGDQWDTSISNVSFTITMPKSFDKSLLGFSSGNVGSTNSSNVTYSVNGNIITGNTIDTLNAGQALTVRLTLPEDYFVGASSDIDMFSIFVIILCAIFVLIADRLWTKYGKDEQVVETIEFYPPEGYNSAEVGFLYNGSADKKGIISLLIYLANQGYLKIEETEEKRLFLKSKGFKITKLKHYDGKNTYERMFFNGLFKGPTRTRAINRRTKEIIKEAKRSSKKISLQKARDMSEENFNKENSVISSDLYDSFYTTLGRIKEKMNSKNNREKIFESSTRSKQKYLIIMIIVIFVLINIKPIAESGGLYSIGIATILFIGSSIVMGKITKMFDKISMIATISVLGIFWTFWTLVALISSANTMSLITYIIGIISIAVLIFFAKIMPKRTPYGNEILGKLRGFKRFLEIAEKTQLEALVNENPEYFYNILPYTYALGVSKVWMSQFETIAMYAPDWYVGYGTFNIYEFNHFMNDTMKSAQSAMSFRQPSNSGGSIGGGSSGGGSSGGGSGGGGGGSW